MVISTTLVTSLLARRDVTVTMTYYVGGVPFMLVIPAGFDLSALVKTDGSIDFEDLARVLGSVRLN